MQGRQMVLKGCEAMELQRWQWLLCKFQDTVATLAPKAGRAKGGTPSWGGLWKRAALRRCCRLCGTVEQVVAMLYVSFSVFSLVDSLQTSSSSSRFRFGDVFLPMLLSLSSFVPFQRYVSPCFRAPKCISQTLKFHTFPLGLKLFYSTQQIQNFTDP
jgi:hypothetical protein